MLHFFCCKLGANEKIARIREATPIRYPSYLSMKSTSEIVSRAKRSVSPCMNLILCLSKANVRLQATAKVTHIARSHPPRTRNLHAAIPILSLLAVDLPREGIVAINLYLRPSLLFSSLTGRGLPVWNLEPLACLTWRTPIALTRDTCST